MTMPHRARLAVLLLAAACARGGATERVTPQVATDDSAAVRPLATRQELEALAQSLGQPASRRGSALLEQVRARLTEGDFKPGDRVLIVVQGDTALSDTFSVWPDRQLHLPSPTLGQLPLRGVLRSELEPRVQAWIARFVRNPVVRARPLIRVSVQGEVVHAGYHAVPADAVLSDALTAAGGTTAIANTSKLRLERNGRTLLDGRELERAMASGQTLDQAGVHEGDQFIVPRRPQGLHENLSFVWLMVSITAGVVALSRVL